MSYENKPSTDTIKVYNGDSVVAEFELPETLEEKTSQKTDILHTEYSFEFDKLRRDRMVLSFYKYGPIKTNYENRLIDAIESLKKRIKMYESTGNLEYLCDIANFAMIEFKHPQHPDAHFKSVDDGKSHIVGMGINEIKNFDK